MLNNFSVGCPIYIACGYTDLRRGIDGLADIIQEQFILDPFQDTLFLFCGRHSDRIKALYWEGDGFVLLYKRLESGSFQWPRTPDEARLITQQQPCRTKHQAVCDGRKNFLFANTPSGAKGGATMFSLIETARENGLDPYRYLTWVFQTAPNLNLQDSGTVQFLLPWNAPESCKAGGSSKN